LTVVHRRKPITNKVQQCAKIGSIVDVNESEDPEGLRIFYYLAQDLRALVFSLISLHFKVKPIPESTRLDFSNESLEWRREIQKMNN